MKLQEWANENIPDEDLIYKDGYWNQIKFVRDEVPRTLAIDYEDLKKIEINVISTHTSKSVKLPVYEILWRGCRFTLRYNFYDWKISVESPVELFPINFFGLFAIGKNIHSVYCEGFPKERVFGSFLENRKKFTIAIDGRYYYIFSFFWILQGFFGIYEERIEARRIYLENLRRKYEERKEN